MKSTVDEQHVLFDYPLLIAKDFDTVLTRKGDPCALTDVVERMRPLGLMLLQARGGAGKTFTARRLAELEPGKHGVAFVTAIDLAIVETDGTPAVGLDDLITAGADVERSRLLRDRGEGLVVIDGVNEIPKRQSDAILRSLPVLAARYPFIRFVVTDRLTRREIDQRDWVLATLGDIPASRVSDLSDADEGSFPEYLKIPFYLEQRLNHNDASTQVEVLHKGIVRHGGVADSDLSNLARVTFDSYRLRRDRRVPESLLVEAVGEDALRRMVDSGLIRIQHTAVQFDHHLTQDYLAALYLSANRDLWTPEGFDVTTLRASSFDALALASALVPTESVEDFVHRVFDWNYYGAAYLIEEDQTSSKRVRFAMRTAVLATLGEKRFDTMVVTVKRVEDALRLQEDSVAEALLNATTRDAVVAIVNASLPADWPQSSPEWFREWHAAFNRSSDDRATRADIAALRSNVGMVGWSASNMLKRLDVPKKLRKKVRKLAARDDSPTVRWRSVHTLGAWPSRSVAAQLISQVNDDDEQLWVRYGALRSALEVAATGREPLRREVLSALADPGLAYKIATDSQLRKEAIRSLEVSPMPAGWHAIAGDFMEFLWASAKDGLDRDEVVLLANRLRLSAAIS
ncbi:MULTISPECIES: HEAT repeat domain-containing protein [Gordonia]|uniref:HEAT repeat domain-containing protein n=1 Tax=Gordonia TaxID=2053 RepID=UPI003394C2F7